MIRLIKADFYRVLHTKGFLATAIAVIAYGLSIVLTGGSGGVSVNQDPSAAMPSGTDLKTSIDAAIYSSSILVYLLIGVFVIVLGYEFTQKTYKNSLTAGASRLQFVVAKYISQVVYLSFFIVLYFVTVMLTAYLKFGSTQANFLAFAGQTILLAIAIGLLISVVFSLASVLLVGLGSMVGAAVFIVLYPILIQVMYSIMNWEQLKYFDFFGFIQVLGVGQVKFDEILPYVIVSAAVTLLSLVASTLLIRNKEL
ncbi:hypothetical protein BAU15_11525 [Enterococcus sp. JM4C]|uniref:ABC transporter permease n=1 Tax=Candidatus Enterococcus huntleyi TaxID=1857217 RepID=UPI00137B886D|nr:ABC transporter permease [Enterococcus sp. JM4C]KAF1297373.1 hypothetical protein BAU15_11525 [Enterococcus sp. JM4C]